MQHSLGVFAGCPADLLNVMKNRSSESGNVILFILIAVVLIGLVTAAMRSTGFGDATIDPEQLTVNVTRVKQYASELENAVVIILTNGASEEDIRFAHPDAPADYGNNYNVTPAAQAFSPKGGGAEYRTAPAGIQNTAAPWEFFGHTAIPGAGGSRAELVAVLPDVTQAFCDKINSMNGQTATPTDSGGAQTACVYGGDPLRFDGGTLYDDTTTNTTDAGSFTVVPAMEACVSCAVDGKLYFYRVLHAR